MKRRTFATGYPIPGVPSWLLARLKLEAWREARVEPNCVDRHVRILSALGWEPNSAMFEGLQAARAAERSGVYFRRDDPVHAPDRGRRAADARRARG